MDHHKLLWTVVAPQLHVVAVIDYIAIGMINNKQSVYT